MAKMRGEVASVEGNVARVQTSDQRAVYLSLSGKRPSVSPGQKVTIGDTFTDDNRQGRLMGIMWEVESEK